MNAVESITTSLPPALVRPARLNEVHAPGVLLQVSKYSAPFLVVGREDEEHVIFLSGDHRFRSFKRSEASNFSGLAIEGIEFDVELESALSISGYSRSPGSLIRRGPLLSIAALADDRFGRTIEIPIRTDLPEGSPDEQTAFYSWRAFVRVGDEKPAIWVCKIPFERDW